MAEEPKPPSIGTTDNHWDELAQKHWVGKKKKPKKVKIEVVEEDVWNVLQNKQFDYSSLLALEGLQLLENYLWPGYDDDATNHHVLLIALLLTTKARERVPTWDVFADDPARFSSIFRRILALSLDPSLNSALRTQLLCFLICAFQSLDTGLVRKECAPLVSISLWHNLASDDIRERKLEGNPQLKKSWRASAKRYNAADELGRARLRFERSWLYTLLIDFGNRIFTAKTDDLQYCERFLELLTDIESQLPTRRYASILLIDLNILPLIRLSPMFNHPDHGLLRDLYILLRHFLLFPIDDYTGVSYTQNESHERHSSALAKLQRECLKSFKDKLTILALANYGSIDQRDELESHLKHLNDHELETLCSGLGYRTKYPIASSVKSSRELFLEILISAHEKRKTFQEAVSAMSVLPTESTIYEESLLRNETYDGSRPLAIPKLNLQYLSAGDFLWRSFILHRCEQFFDLRVYLEEVIKKLQPLQSGPGESTKFSGFSRVALPIAKPALLEVAPARVGFNQPAYVRAEIILDVSRLADSVRKEWDSLRPDDTVYLLSVIPLDKNHHLTNGHNSIVSKGDSGLDVLRVAEVVQLLEDNGRPIREASRGQTNGYGPRPRIRRLMVNLDAAAFEADKVRKERGMPDIYEKVNVIVRRSNRENNFKRILETIQNLAVSEFPMPTWLQEVFLGFGDPSSATYMRLPNHLKAIDLRDTLIDWRHLLASFPDKAIEPLDGTSPNTGPPYVLEILGASQPPPTKLSKKRRRDEAELDEGQEQTSKALKVSTYHTPSNGPYPSDTPRSNLIRFTPVQVEAIISGTQPGLTIVVGPPGTGKTDVATQIISNLYHNFPSQRTLLVAHSNQALNQLFQKIIKLDIDGRHMLRLGQGEGELETDASYSKLGRVDSFLENRAFYLAEVDRLAINMGAPGAHGASCETAGYFNLVYIQPAWLQFWDVVHAAASSSAAILSSFPFYQYFQSAPQPLFPQDASRETWIDIARGCKRHIDKIFSELEDIRPFEILRSNKDKTNYLMIKEARIIAMTSTHAAMRQQEIADLGFHYDNVVMEEAAQVTEIENFIPLTMQKPRNGRLPLQRIVLCGDHLQNSPIIQNKAFREFSNLEQSLFLRLVRLGVPTINLDAQGRARPSIAELYRWRYSKLDNLPNVLTDPEFRRANAGFRFEYQFIDVPEYKGKGEIRPSPHFVQNLGEAEYAVAIYQYMRLLGYPASKISILTTYAGQRALIRDVLDHRCAGNRLFGMPRVVVTVDKYQGEQNDYIILSLVRTTAPGYLRDLRRLTVALSRARLGLYILGRRSVFDSSAEFTKAFALPLGRPGNLMLTTDEMFPAQRLLDDDVAATEMTGVEHLGQYVYEMTQTKVKMLKEGSISLPSQEPESVLDMNGKEDNSGRTEDDQYFEGDEVVELPEGDQTDAPP